MKQRLFKLLSGILAATLLFSIAAPIVSSAEPDLPLPTEEQAKEAALGALFSFWLLQGYYDDFCMTDEEWAVRMTTIVNPETCNIYREWLKENGLLLYETPARRVFDIVDPYRDEVVESLDMHAFPEGVTEDTLEALFDRYALKRNYIRYFSCTEIHDYDEPCYNVYMQEADSLLYGLSEEYDPDYKYNQGPFTCTLDELTTTATSHLGGSLYVSISLCPGYANDLFFVQMTEKGCRVVDSKWHIFRTFDYDHPHIPYDPSHEEIYEAAFKATFLASGVYSNFPSTTAQMPQDEWEDLELRQFEHQWLTEQGLLLDWSAPTLSKEMGLTTEYIFHHSYSMARPFAGDMTAEKFKQIARSYLAEEYVEQMFENSYRGLTEYNGKLYNFLRDAGSLVTYKYRLTRIVSLEEDRAVLSFDENGGMHGDAGTLEMTKTKEGWKATGGDFFDACFELKEPDVIDLPEAQDPPKTGESILPFVLVCLPCTVCVAGLLIGSFKRRKKII